MTGRVVVVGSCHLDLVVSGGPLPRPGETVRARALSSNAGGKGVNQAIAAVRAGADVRMIGAVGDDAGGRLVRSELARTGVDTTLLRTVDSPTSSAVVTVDATGENAISVVGGAGDRLTSLTVEDRIAITSADAVMIQFELPMTAVLETAAWARSQGVLTVLTPAPIRPIPAALGEAVGLLLLNRKEAEALTGAPSAVDACAILARTTPQVVVTAGRDGAWFQTSRECGHTPTDSVQVVDTTAAGDTFAGYLVAAMTEGASLRSAAGVATAAAALSVTRPGAARSIPDRSELPPSALRRG